MPGIKSIFKCLTADDEKITMIIYGLFILLFDGCRLID
jgi:hypothetical protein